LPTAISTSPVPASARIASRTTGRLTPKVVLIAVSLGSFDPGRRRSVAT
jgi:hypothetical protein